MTTSDAGIDVEALDVDPAHWPAQLDTLAPRQVLARWKGVVRSGQRPRLWFGRRPTESGLERLW
ncbi:hypothetical protein [Brachybacterium alimentarium]|uniref:hypothetical protein n=1 Tax=Brachybacterium alimentarium TaxID=47845 RepID=UPI003FD6AA97